MFSKYFGSLRQLTIASNKMYFRDFTAIFFSIIFPVIFLVVFGFISTQDQLRLNVAYFNEKSTPESASFDDTFSNLVIDESQNDDYNDGRIFKIDSEFEDVEVAKNAVSDGDLHVVFVVSNDFGKNGGGEIEAYYDEGESEFGGTAISIVNGILEEFNLQANVEKFNQTPISPFAVRAESIETSNLNSIDYVIPGIIGFSIMSLGIFSIAQGFITYKSSGALRRLFATPVHPFSFLTAQTITRLIMTVLNVIIMLGIAIAMFNFTMVGDYLTFTVVSMIGAILFLGIGFAIAGWAKNENQAAPLANIIFFPMMFLAGTFFPREVFPEWIQTWSEFLPLSYLTDALRLIANEGAPIYDLGTELLGMVVWIVIVYVIAVRVFRWE